MRNRVRFNVVHRGGNENNDQCQTKQEWCVIEPAMKEQTWQFPNSFRLEDSRRDS